MQKFFLGFCNAGLVQTQFLRALQWEELSPASPRYAQRPSPCTWNLDGQTDGQADPRNLFFLRHFCRSMNFYDPKRCEAPSPHLLTP